MTAKRNRFVITYYQDGAHETIIILTDAETGKSYLQIISEKGIALTAL